MKNKKFILPCLLAFLGMGVAYADSNPVYAYVQKVTLGTSGETTGKITSSTTVAADGMASFDTNACTDTYAVMEFDEDNNAVMTIDGVTVAKLKATEWINSGGGLAADFTNGPEITETNSLTATVTTDKYATLYSPFRLQVPSSTNGIDIYAPSYNKNTHMVVCNANTKVAAGAVIPAGTGLVLHKGGITKDETITFSMVRDGTAYDASKDDLTGAAIDTLINKGTYNQSSITTGDVVYTLGHEKGKTATDETMGFFKYVGKWAIGAGKAYLVAPAWTPTATQAKSYISFCFDDDVVTGIDNVDADVDASADVDAGVNTQAPKKTGKFFVNGRVVIFRDGHLYNLSGQEVR